LRRHIDIFPGPQHDARGRDDLKCVQHRGRRKNWL
jgi:hypothetical protein